MLQVCGLSTEWLGLKASLCWAGRTLYKEVHASPPPGVCHRLQPQHDKGSRSRSSVPHRAEVLAHLERRRKVDDTLPEVHKCGTLRLHELQLVIAH
jgi:hypothetical protein